MFPTSFDYVTAGTVQDVLALLEKHGDDAKLLAGGHSLIPLMKLRLAAPKFIVDIGGVAGLHGIDHMLAEGGHVQIGALTTHADVAASEVLARECPLLRETAGEIGDVQVRNRGTIGGSLAHADPAADYPAAILALEAEIVVEGLGGEFRIPAANFFVDTFQTALATGEILTGVRIPRHLEHSGSAYVKVHHPSSGYALVGVAAMLVVESGKITRARVGVTGLGPKAFRATGVETALEGQEPSAANFRAAAAHVADGVEALTDAHTSAEYRAELARIITRRALERAASRVAAA
jgi:carbon-monoxide dehydrogenase medium subunit